MKHQGLTFKDSDSLNFARDNFYMVDNQPEIELIVKSNLYLYLLELLLHIHFFLHGPAY